MATIVPYIIAFAATCIATSLVLADRFGRGMRGPIGSWLAVGLWSALLLCDGFVAALMIGGATLFSVPVAATGLSGVSRAVLIGVLGPLSIRSPVRSTEIKGVNYNVGVTYVYDIFWRNCQSSLDSAMAALGSEDRTKAVAQLKGLGWTADSIERRLSRHIGELRVRGQQEKDKLHRQIDTAMTNPTEDGKLRALIVLAQTERLEAILAPCRKRRPLEQDG